MRRSFHGGASAWGGGKDGGIFKLGGDATEVVGLMTSAEECGVGQAAFPS